MTQIHPENCRDDSIQAHAGAHVNNVRIDVGRPTLAVMTVFAVLLGVLGTVLGMDISDRNAFARENAAQAAMLAERMQDLQRQYRMTELKLDDWTVVAHRSGLILPGDYTRGPQGNLDSESFKKPKGK